MQSNYNEYSTLDTYVNTHTTSTMSAMKKSDYFKTLLLWCTMYNIELASCKMSLN